MITKRVLPILLVLLMALVIYKNRHYSSRPHFRESFESLENGKVNENYLPEADQKACIAAKFQELSRLKGVSSTFFRNFMAVSGFEKWGDRKKAWITGCLVRRPSRSKKYADDSVNTFLHEAVHFLSGRRNDVYVLAGLDPDITTSLKYYPGMPNVSIICDYFKGDKSLTKADIYLCGSTDNDIYILLDEWNAYLVSWKLRMDTDRSKVCLGYSHTEGEGPHKAGTLLQNDFGHGPIEFEMFVMRYLLELKNTRPELWSKIQSDPSLMKVVSDFHQQTQLILADSGKYKCFFLNLNGLKDRALKENSVYGKLLF